MELKDDLMIEIKRSMIICKLSKFQDYFFKHY
jgi:hypothetical protein